MSTMIACTPLEEVASPVTDATVLFRLQIQKTSLCKFHASRKCRNGKTCPFAHSQSELTVAPDLTKTSICKAWKNKACTMNSNQCPFAHGAQELRRTPLFKGTTSFTARTTPSEDKGERDGRRTGTRHSDLAPPPCDFSQQEDGETSFDTFQNRIHAADPGWSCEAVAKQKTEHMERTPPLSSHNRMKFQRQPPPPLISLSDEIDRESPMEFLPATPPLSESQCELLAQILQQAAPDFYED